MCVLALFGVHALNAHTHMRIALHILCFVLQSRFMCAAKHPPCCKAPSVLQSTRCCKATSVLQSTTYYVLQRYCLCCKATDSDTSAVLLMLHGMFNATKTVIYCSYLPGYVGCIYDDDNGKMSRTLDCDVWKLFVTWK